MTNTVNDKISPEAFLNQIKDRAKAINPATFISFFTYECLGDPYGLHPPDENDNIGRMWWVNNPDIDGFAVAAYDFIEAHPEVSWEDIYSREEQWSIDADPFHGIFR